MKNLGIIAAMVGMFATSPLTAQQDTCVTLGLIAASIMESRQAGKPPSYWMEILSNLNDTPPGTNQFITAIIMSAYDIPRYKTAADRAAAVQEHRSAMEAICYDKR